MSAEQNWFFIKALNTELNACPKVGSPATAWFSTGDCLANFIMLIVCDLLVDLLLSIVVMETVEPDQMRNKELNPINRKQR